jgi:HD-like signal output (HDOD) protein
MGAAGPSERGAGAPSAGASPVAGLPDGIQALVSDEVRARVQAGSWKVPLLPQVASQVISLAASPEVDAARLSALIHKDPSLAGQVLRTSNSAAYAPRMPIVSLQQAVARLGLGVISEIAFSASLQSGTFKVPGHEGDLQALWRHALASGAWGKEVARLRRSNVESAFLCGLLHGVGKPAVLQIAVDAAIAAGGTPPPRLDRGFLASLYTQHQTAVGRRIAEAWSLPGAVAAAIVHHHQPGEAGAFQNDALTTRLSALLASWSMESEPQSEASGEAQLREDPVIEQLNIYPEDLDGLIGKRAAVLAVVDALTV